MNKISKGERTHTIQKEQMEMITFLDFILLKRICEFENVPPMRTFLRASAHRQSTKTKKKSEHVEYYFRNRNITSENKM